MESAPKLTNTVPEEATEDASSLSRRGFLMGMGAVAVTSIPKMSSAEQSNYTESAERPPWLEKITRNNVDISYGFESSNVADAAGEALVIIDWQERFIHPDLNEHPEVQQQFLETQAAIIERIVSVMETGQPIVLVGVASEEGVGTDALKTGGSVSDILAINPQYPKEIIDLVNDYENVHFIMKDRNSVAAEKSTSRDLIETILKPVSDVRIVGVNESFCGWSSVNDIAQSDFAGTGKRVIINPSELADSQSALESGTDAREMYTDLPKNMLFREALSLFFQEREEELSNIKLKITFRREGAEIEEKVLTFHDIEEDYKKFIETMEFPTYFK